MPKRKRLTLQDTRYKSVKTWLRAAIRRLVEMEVADSWKGGGDPADWPAIEAALEEARAELRDVLAHVDDIHDRDIARRFPV